MTQTKKRGRPFIQPGQQRVTTHVSLTKQLQIAFLRLGGSKWLREQIEKASNDKT